jgi:hypothetical protein
MLAPQLLRCAAVSARVAWAEPPFGWLGARALFVAGSRASHDRGGRYVNLKYCPEVAPAMQQWLRDALGASQTALD